MIICKILTLSGCDTAVEGDECLHVCSISRGPAWSDNLQAQNLLMRSALLLDTGRGRTSSKSPAA